MCDRGRVKGRERIVEATPTLYKMFRPMAADLTVQVSEVHPRMMTRKGSLFKLDGSFRVEWRVRVGVSVYVCVRVCKCGGVSGVRVGK